MSIDANDIRLDTEEGRERLYNLLVNGVVIDDVISYMSIGKKGDYRGTIRDLSDLVDWISYLTDIVSKHNISTHYINCQVKDGVVVSMAFRETLITPYVIDMGKIFYKNSEAIAYAVKRNNKRKG